MMKEQWMQEHFGEFFHDLVDKKALLDSSLGVRAMIRPENPLEHGLNELSACRRMDVAVEKPVRRAGMFGLFAPQQEKPSTVDPTPTHKKTP